MEINHKIEFVEGPFDTETGKMVCVGKKKHGEVLLCFHGNMNIPFARIKLHSKDLAIDADAVFDDAYRLGEEIVSRWNHFAKEAEPAELKYYCDRQRHLVCIPYSIDNLHKMAEDLGIKRCWFHKHHYDIPKKRVEEIAAKCVQVSPKDIVKIIKEKKQCHL